MGRDKQLAAITSLNLCAKATIISLIMNNGGGNTEACLCKFPHTVISSMLNSQNSGGTPENSPPPSFSPLNRLTCFYFPLLSSPLSVFFFIPPPSFMSSLNQNIHKSAEEVLISVSAKPFRLIANNPEIVWDIEFYIPPPANTSPCLGTLPSSFPFSSINFLYSLCFFYAFHLHFYCFIASLSPPP